MARFPWAWRLLRGPVRGFFDRISEGWDERVQPDSPEHLAALAAAVERLPTEPARILDLGTGTGAAALWLARRFPAAEVVGVDISEPMIAAARAKIDPGLAERVSFDVADAAALASGDASYALVTQVSVPVFFDEIARVLRPGGHILVVSSLGSRTPFHTPVRLLERGFAQRGLLPAGAGQAGPGSYFIARRPPSGA